MKFKLTDARLNNLGMIEINTIEELMKLYKDKGRRLIIGECDGPEIQIYNDYIE